MKKILLAAVAALLSTTVFAADIPTKAPTGYSQYPTTSCGLYYGVNTMGSSAAVENAAVGTQFIQGAIGLTLGYTCPVGQGYWFVDGMFDFANLNGSSNGLSLTGPAQFEQRFGFGAPVPLLISLIPGLASLQNAVPSLIPLPTGVSVVTSFPYLYGSIHEDDTGVSNGLASMKQYLVSAGFGIGNKIRLSNGVVFDPFAEYVLPSSQMCIGITSSCVKRGPGIRFGAALEF